MIHLLAQLLRQFCQFPISPSRTRQRVEQPKSKSTQPRFARRCVTLYKNHVCNEFSSPEELTGCGLTFTVGRGNELVMHAVDSLRFLAVDRFVIDIQGLH